MENLTLNKSGYNLKISCPSPQPQIIFCYVSMRDDEVLAHEVFGVGVLNTAHKGTSEDRTILVQSSLVIYWNLLLLLNVTLKS